VTQSIQKEAQGFNLKKKGNWVKPNEKFCSFARTPHIFRHWCKRQGFQRCYLVVLNDIVYEETDITHIQMLCSLVVEKPICGVVCRNWRRRRRWEAKSRRRKTPRRSKSYQSTPTGLSSNKLSFSSIYLSISLSLSHTLLLCIYYCTCSWFYSMLTESLGLCRRYKFMALGVQKHQIQRPKILF